MKIRSSGLSSIAVRLSHAGLGYAAAVLLARGLGVQQFGLYTFAFAAVAILSVPVQHGISALLVRETTRFRSAQDWTSLAELRRWANTTVSRISLAILVPALLVLVPLKLYGIGGYVVPLLVALPLLPLTLGNAVRGSILIGLRQVVLGQLPEYVLRPVAFIMLLLLGFVVSADMVADASVAMALQVLAAAVSLAAAHWLVLRKSPVSSTRWTSATGDRNWGRALLPLAIVSGMQYVVVYSDLILLGLLGTTADVGLYRVASQTALLIPFVLQAVNAVMAPVFADRFQRRDKAGLQEAILSSGRIILVATLPIFLAAIFFGDALLPAIFGAEYQKAYPALVILGLAQFTNVATGSVLYLLTMTGHELAAARVLGACAFLNVVLNILMIPALGLVGAALASAVTITASNLILRFLVLKQLDVEPSVIGRLWPSSDATRKI